MALYNNYFLITGFDEGIPIDQYIVTTDTDYPILPSNDFGDSTRYYTPLSKDEVIKHLANGVEII